ncbi:TolC family protein [Lusitaniella coriacea LEGE 07157]|uniref:TolC family protein n=1 Tax=Lusitaniella coriacea LEGE 07157 TaxID=945747 RepID=A0A8J7DZX6_9CYAN|nr:TolC family protein [Lusitaniella coriacea]MBE9117901.1 TolC family protein [Lusitaniella coriacea LEGE 07157]
MNDRFNLQRLIRDRDNNLTSLSPRQLFPISSQAVRVGLVFIATISTSFFVNAALRSQPEQKSTVPHTNALENSPNPTVSNSKTTSFSFKDFDRAFPKLPKLSPLPKPKENTQSASDPLIPLQPKKSFTATARKEYERLLNLLQQEPKKTSSAFRRTRAIKPPQSGSPQSRQPIPQRPNLQPHPESNLRIFEQQNAFPITLLDAVTLALANNRDIKNAYLERIVQRADLEVAESTFTPKITPRLEARVLGDGIDGIDTRNRFLDLGASISIKIPTGAEAKIDWGTNLRSFNSRLAPLSNTSTLRQQVNFNIKQPLLRNAGVAVNTADLEKARLTEVINQLELRKTLIDRITDVIFAYRTLIQAQERILIEENALVNAKQQLEITSALIEAGRVAGVEIVQSQALVADIEVRLVEAKNNLEQARSNLIDLLDIDENLRISAIKELEIDEIELNPEELQQFMFANRAEYLQNRLEVERSQLSLLQAENARLWGLDLEANIGETVDNRMDVRAGLVLSRELNDRAIERDFERSRINLLQAENNLAGSEESLNLELANRIRDVELSLRQVELARNARELAERNLEIEQQKQALNRSNIFDIVEVQNDLVNARNIELNAIIDYFNAQTLLDKTIGNTLNTWGVEIDRE